MHRMGDRIRRRRENRGLRVSELADMVGVSSSLISQIERGKAFPSILTLKKIADTLHTTVGDLLGESASLTENPHMKESEKKFVKRNSHGANVYLLSHHDPQKQMDPFLIEFDTKGNSTQIMTPKNPRQEFCYVLDGEFEVHLGDKKYVLKRYDSFYFFSNKVHQFTNINKGKSQLLWIVNQSDN
jgi:transcriptional regulator with XRE-family HTH domain